MRENTALHTLEDGVRTGNQFYVPCHFYYDELKRPFPNGVGRFGEHDLGSGLMFPTWTQGCFCNANPFQVSIQAAMSPMDTEMSLQRQSSSGEHLGSNVPHGHRHVSATPILFR